MDIRIQAPDCVLIFFAWQVDPPRESGVSYDRKIKSYAAEAAFYGHYSSRVLEAGGAAAIAEALLVDVSPPTHFLFVLSDLRVGFPKSKGCLDKQVRHLAECQGQQRGGRAPTARELQASRGTAPNSWANLCTWLQPTGIPGTQL